MTQHEYRLNMDMMFAVHDALRRDLVQVARIAAAHDGSPGRRLHAVRGWVIFKKFLEVHHAAEDETLWPALRVHAARQPDQIALADAMEAEHAAIDPLLAAADAAAADPGHGHQRLGDCIDELVMTVTRHLAHEESDGLDLIDALMTPGEWQHFATVHRERVGEDRVRYLPWIMEEASARTVAHVEGTFPGQLLAAYQSKWSADFTALDRWEAAGDPVS